MKRLLTSIALLGLTLGGCAPHVPVASPHQRAQVHVVMYATAWCPVCGRARDWFARRGIPYDEYDVESDHAAAARFRQLNPAGSVPVIDVEGRVMVGFVAEDVRRAVDSVAHERYPEQDEEPEETAGGQAEPAAADEPPEVEAPVAQTEPEAELESEPPSEPAVEAESEADAGPEADAEEPTGP